MSDKLSFRPGKGLCKSTLTRGSPSGDFFNISLGHKILRRDPRVGYFCSSPKMGAVDHFNWFCSTTASNNRISRGMF